MQITTGEIASFLGGELEGDPNIILTGPAKIEEGKPGAITFLANPRYEEYIYSTKASAVLVNKTFQPQSGIKATLIRVPDVYGAIAQLLNAFSGGEDIDRKIDPLAIVESNAKIGEEVAIGALSVISAEVEIGDRSVIHPQVFIGKNVKIGKNAKIYPGVRILHNCIIGDNCTIHSNTVIGADGFGFQPNEKGNYEKVPQIGNVVIGNHVEIGSNTVIDRATMGSTVIQNGVKLDNLIQIAHNVIIGENTVMAAQCGVAGSAKIGKNCMIGGQVGISGHIKVADGTKIAGQSGIMGTIKEEGTSQFGSPAIPYNDFLKSYIGFKKLPEIMKKMAELEKQLNEIKAKS
jgi:UDP-3-O-[3-hydroxymyristoyl] glucosamine N-acyltransferase